MVVDVSDQLVTNATEEMDNFVERNWMDPRSVAWEDVVNGLHVMGLDVSDNGDSIIEVDIRHDHLTIKRARQNANPEPRDKSGHDEFGPPLWSVTKDILMQPRRPRQT